MRNAALLVLVLMLALASACGSPGSGPAPGAAMPPPSITGGGATLDVSYSTSRGVVADALPVTQEAAWEALPKAYADLVIPEGGFNARAMKALSPFLRQIAG